MKKLFLILGIVSSCCFALDNEMTPQGNDATPPYDSTGFNQSRTWIQANYFEMYRALPFDKQNKVQYAATSMENIRLKPPLEADAILANERQYTEQSVKTAVSQMSVTDAVKTQIENARSQINQRMSEKVINLKARRAAVK
jgi:hypothetical protein